MQRTLYKELKRWKERPARLPLVIRGARQVGKNFLVEKFGREEFDQLLVLNFEKRPHFARCFASLDPKEILKAIELATGTRVVVGKALLFLDEIQDCPPALKALRYFAEEMPDLHVIAAGSLLEFVLEDSAFSFPVGRIQLVNLGPLTFSEYLLARGQHPLAEFLKEATERSAISEAVHERLLELVREFLMVGGMPGVVAVFQETDSYVEVQRQQSAILDLYALDFGKYATKHAKHRHLRKLFERAPDLVGKHFRFSKIDPECANAARDYREAFHRLTQARLIVPVHATAGNGLPLRAEKRGKKLKIFMLDVGLLVLGLGWESLGLTHHDESAPFRGIVAEQFVAQELIALQDPFIDRGLYYWEQDRPHSSAEIDFLINLNRRILPIEVKSGATGRLKSLRQFMEVKRVPLGIRISQHPLSFEEGILSVPFYLVGELPRLVERVGVHKFGP